MSDNQLTQVSFKEIEDEMQKFNPGYQRRSLQEIARAPQEEYQLYATMLDDHFTLLLRSQDKNAVLEAKKYLLQERFPVFGKEDTYGYDLVKEDFLFRKKLPKDDVDAAMKKAAEYLAIDPNHREDYGKNKEGDYYFYFLPLNTKVRSYSEFKKGLYLDHLNDLAKKSHQSIDLIFAQLDNVVYGGLKLPGIASPDFYSAFFEAVNVQVLKGDKRALYIASKVLMELSPEEKEVFDLGLFQMFLVDKPIFSMPEIEEIYLDFPNEVDEHVLEEK